MQHPHMSDECEIDVIGGELTCENTNRFHHPQLRDEDTIEVTCSMQAHEIGIVELPDHTLITETRRLFENDRVDEDLRDRLVTEMESRELSVPDEPDDLNWFAIEATYAEVKELEENGYPEAFQMAEPNWQPAEDEDDFWSRPDEDDPHVMLISEWGLHNIPDEYTERAIPLFETDFDSLKEVV